jgi:glycosyltransferase involved in cell wall biosynthesis
MSEHDVLCLSSDHEGWAMVLLEATATGMPVITTDVGCAGEIIRNNENGKIVSVGNVEEYTLALKQYCADIQLIFKHGRRGYELASTELLSNADYLLKLVESYTSCE